MSIPSESKGIVEKIISSFSSLSQRLHQWMLQLQLHLWLCRDRCWCWRLLWWRRWGYLRERGGFRSVPSTHAYGIRSLRDIISRYAVDCAAVGSVWHLERVRWNGYWARIVGIAVARSYVHITCGSKPARFRIRLLYRSFFWTWRIKGQKAQCIHNDLEYWNAYRISGQIAKLIMIHVVPLPYKWQQAGYTHLRRNWRSSLIGWAVPYP